MSHSLNELAREINAIAKEKGWHDEERSFGEYCALFHAEISEALEEHRAGRHNRESYYSCKSIDGPNRCTRVPQNCYECEFAKPEGIPIELADCIIRILDFCGQYDIDIDEVIRTKIEYNKTREYKHGGKKI